MTTPPPPVDEDEEESVFREDSFGTDSPLAMEEAGDDPEDADAEVVLAARSVPEFVALTGGKTGSASGIFSHRLLSSSHRCVFSGHRQIYALTPEYS